MSTLTAFMLRDRLYPVDEASRLRWGRIPRGPELDVSIVRRRSLPQLRMARKLVASVTEAMRDGPDGIADTNDEWTMTTLSLAAGTGIVRPMSPLERRFYGDGPIVAMRRSTAFDRMDSGEFTRWLDGAASFLMLPEWGWIADSRPGRDAMNILAKMRAEPPQIGGGA